MWASLSGRTKSAQGRSKRVEAMMREARSALTTTSTLSTTSVSVIVRSKACVAATRTWRDVDSSGRAPLRVRASRRSKARARSRSSAGWSSDTVAGSARMDFLYRFIHGVCGLMVVGRSCESVSRTLKFSSRRLGREVRSEPTSFQSSSAGSCGSTGTAPPAEVGSTGVAAGTPVGTGGGTFAAHMLKEAAMIGACCCRAAPPKPRARAGLALSSCDDLGMAHFFFLFLSPPPPPKDSAAPNKASSLTHWMLFSSKSSSME
mmetsp:Transcript_21314/g.66855  ORF Transcript_21314/g.66855 Transcript_21314/m.66855 type:complete len:261 (-) Transcript_21314:2027-2809(-)